MTELLNWLVVGNGMAGRVHQQAISRVEGAQLVGVVSRQSTAEGDVPTFPTVDAALDGGEVDVAVIATPNHTHSDFAATLIAAGVPVLCEKPAGRSADEAKVILGLSQRHGVPVGVVLNQRFCSANQWVRRLVANNELNIQSINFELTIPALRGWHADVESSGGGLLRLIGVHYLDLLCWWLGQPAEIRGNISGQPVDDDVDISLGFAGNCNGRLRLKANGEARGGPIRCRITATQGEIELLGHTVAAYTGVSPPPEQEVSYPDQWFGPGHQALLQETTASLVSTGKFPVGLAEALPTLMQMDRIYRELN